MRLKELARSLHPLERKLFKYLAKEFKSYKELAKISGLKDIEVLRALGWLKNKGLVELKEETKKEIILTEIGKKYKDTGLPEVVIFNYLKKVKEASREELKKLGLDEKEINAGLGRLKKKGVIDIIKRDNSIILRLIKEFAEFPEQEVYSKILKGETGQLDTKILKDLKKRGIIEIKETKEYYARLTDLGEKLVKEGYIENLIDVVTREVIEKKEWINKEFRKFDIKTPVKPKWFGKKHPYLKYLESVREYLIGLGFEEMKGNIVLPSFWNMDVLFVPHDHPSREIHDVFFVKDLSFNDIPKNMYDKVKDIHLKKWKYWDDELSKKAVLRSHVTSLSALTMLKAKIPGKYFAIERVFRPDTIDATHFIEFRQLEGIVLDENLTFRDLLGLLEEFARVFANTEKVKFYPGYFPFTEPSVELYVKHPTLGWMEIGGAGIFREEVTEPFGIDVPVIAWGLGIDRMAMLYLGLEDIRNFWSRDLRWLINKELTLL